VGEVEEQINIKHSVTRTATFGTCQGRHMVVPESFLEKVSGIEMLSYIGSDVERYRVETENRSALVLPFS
jgi:hypothetical protein